MTRFLGTLLLLLALLPRIAGAGEATGALVRDGRAIAVSSNVDHFINLAEPGTQKRVLDGGSSGGIGYSPLSGRCAQPGISGLLRRIPGVIPPHPAHACRPHSERLPYDATAPPSSPEPFR